MWHFRRPTADLARSAIGATKVVGGRGRCFEVLGMLMHILMRISKIFMNPRAQVAIADQH